MRIPDNIFLGISEESELIMQWQRKAVKISMKKGIYISIDLQHRTPGGDLREINFVMLGHKYPSLDELKRAIKLQAFL
jgi:hypothetical protein